MTEFHEIYLELYFAELSTKLQLAEENNDILSKQIQEYRAQSDDSIKIIHEKQKLVSIFFLCLNIK